MDDEVKAVMTASLLAGLGATNSASDSTITQAAELAERIWEEVLKQRRHR